MEIASFEKFLVDKIKVGNKTGEYLVLLPGRAAAGLVLDGRHGSWSLPPPAGLFGLGWRRSSSDAQPQRRQQQG